MSELTTERVKEIWEEAMAATRGGFRGTFTEEVPPLCDALLAAWEQKKIHEADSQKFRAAFLAERAELKLAVSGLTACSMECNELRARAEKAEAEAAALLQALQKYSKHEKDCNYSHLSKSDVAKFTPCNCGLHEFIFFPEHSAFLVRYKAMEEALNEIEQEAPEGNMFGMIARKALKETL